MKVFCHQCGKNTNHKVIAEKKIGAGNDDHFQWGQTHYFARCAGCDAFTYAIENWSEDDWNPQTGEMESTWETYPRGATERQAMDDEDELPAKVHLIYRELIGAMVIRISLALRLYCYRRPVNRQYI